MANHTLSFLSKRDIEMARYDGHCSACDITLEYTCSIADRESQTCIQCGGAVEPLFSPPTVIRIPPSFKYAYSDLFGTSSEKDYRRANPDLEVASHSGTDNSERAKAKRERERDIKEGLEVEKTLLAQGKLKRPIQTEAGSTDSDVIGE